MNNVVIDKYGAAHFVMDSIKGLGNENIFSVWNNCRCTLFHR